MYGRETTEHDEHAVAYPTLLGSVPYYNRMYVKRDWAQEWETERSCTSETTKWFMLSSFINAAVFRHWQAPFKIRRQGNILVIHTLNGRTMSKFTEETSAISYFWCLISPRVPPVETVLQLFNIMHYGHHRRKNGRCSGWNILSHLNSQTLVLTV